MSNRQLPPNPPGCVSLTDPEVARLRKQHPDLWANPRSTCLTCRKEATGQTTFQTRDGGQVVTFDCSCVEQWRLNRWLLNAGVGLRYQRLSWDHAVHAAEAAQVATLEYIENAPALVNQGRGITLWSPHKGTGKTMLATLLVKGLMADGHDGYLTQFNEMIDLFTAGWRDETERAWFIRRIRNAGVLVVDDMGREHKGRTEMVEAMFDTVIRARVAASKPTIITTNFTPDEMHQGYGGNVLSLLSEVNTFVDVPGRDFRPQVAEQALRDAQEGVTYPVVVR